jgi:hypothetical protein
MTTFADVSQPGRKLVLGVEDWTGIRRLAGLRRADAIAWVLVVAGNTVKAALASSGPAAMSGRIRDVGGDQPETDGTCSASTSSLCCARGKSRRGLALFPDGPTKPKLYAVW